jgi:hypothetical protein
MDPETRPTTRWITNERENPMFKLHSNPTQQDNHPTRKRLRIRPGILAAGVLGAGFVGTLGAGAAYADPGLYTTVTYHGPTLKPWYTATMPRLGCPADHPYLLNQRYNTDTSFRLDPGVEFTDWNGGFDAFVSQNVAFTSQSTSKGDVRTGLSGDNRYANSQVTNWNPFASTNWTLVLHCTSDLNQAVFQS